MAKGLVVSSPMAMIFIGVVFCFIGIVFLCLSIPNYQSVANAQIVTLDKVMSLPDGTVIKVPVTITEANLLTAENGQKLIYEHVKIERKTGSGKNRTVTLEQEERSPSKLVVSDGTSTLEIPVALIDDNFVDRIGPHTKNSGSFDKAKAMLIPKFADLATKVEGERELTVSTLPANTPMTLMLRRSNQIPGIPLAGVSDGFIKSGIILTHKTTDEVLNQLKLGLIAISIFLVAGVGFLGFGAFQFMRRVA